MKKEGSVREYNSGIKYMKEEKVQENKHKEEEHGRIILIGKEEQKRVNGQDKRWQIMEEDGVEVVAVLLWELDPWEK
jgi:hypothetical protein